MDRPRLVGEALADILGGRDDVLAHGPHQGAQLSLRLGGEHRHRHPG
ncbi:UNVERIFIED_ORG: hypothetical protein M2438_003238 [Methylobacterium sp. SuP10 SLI 274]|nr:hypothetical protein [Methylobacterium sp. SuP10 SLI 274]